LKRKIQVAEHDSVVDARAALDLVKLKIAKGPAYGTVSQHEEQGDRLMDVLHAHDRRCTLIDRTDMLNRHVTGQYAVFKSLVLCAKAEQRQPTNGALAGQQGTCSAIAPPQADVLFLVAAVSSRHVLQLSDSVFNSGICAC